MLRSRAAALGIDNTLRTKHMQPYHLCTYDADINAPLPLYMGRVVTVHVSVARPPSSPKSPAPTASPGTSCKGFSNNSAAEELKVVEHTADGAKIQDILKHINGTSRTLPPVDEDDPVLLVRASAPEARSPRDRR